MQTARIACPHCSKELTLGQTPRVGCRVRCTRCGAAFALTPEDVLAAAAAASPPAAYAPPPRPVTYAPRPAPAARPPAKVAPPEPPRSDSRGWLVLASVVAVSLLLLGGAGAALAWHFSHKKDPQQAALPGGTDAPGVGAPDPAPADDGGPPRKPTKPQRRKSFDLTPDDAPPDLAPEPPPAPEPPWLAPEEQERVVKAIDHGVKYLEKTQGADGSWAGQWGGGHAVGLAALPALTLLECEVPADDPHVKKAAQFVRANGKNLGATYELALSILLLDKLGDPADDELIQTLALRLIAGQSPAGGWTYNCPVLSPKDQHDLLLVMEKTRPASRLDLVAPKPGDKATLDLFAPRPADKPSPDKVAGPGGEPPRGVTGPDKKPSPDRPGGTIPLNGDRPRDGVPPLSAAEEAKEKAEAKKVFDALPPGLKHIPSVQPPAATDAFPGSDNSDNSNTQFAILGLWAARRHNVPMERALDLITKRFRVSQRPDGGWGYPFAPGGQGAWGTEAMTGAGLLGLAVGHGVDADLRGTDIAQAAEDPAVEKGLKALSQNIGQPVGADRKNKAAPNWKSLYFLWSVERVGVLYNLHKINDKDWYPWGAEMLVDQQQDGSWANGGYPGAMPTADSCFALLFLKRANLAKDLSPKLEFLMRTRPRDDR